MVRPPDATKMTVADHFAGISAEDSRVSFKAGQHFLPCRVPKGLWLAKLQWFELQRPDKPVSRTAFEWRRTLRKTGQAGFANRMLAKKSLQSQLVVCGVGLGRVGATTGKPLAAGHGRGNVNYPPAVVAFGYSHHFQFRPGPVIHRPLVGWFHHEPWYSKFHPGMQIEGAPNSGYWGRGIIREFRSVGVWQFDVTNLYHNLSPNLPGSKAVGRD